MSTNARYKRSASDSDAEEPRDASKSWLSVRQLFELRTEVLGLIGAGQADSDEQARAILQTILARAEQLLQVIEDGDAEDSPPGFREPAGICFDELGDHEAHLYHLKGFALHETALLLDRTPSTLASAPKRIKLEKPASLMDQAAEAYMSASAEGSPQPSIWDLFHVGSFTKARADACTFALRTGDADLMKRHSGYALIDVGLDLWLLDELAENPFAEDSFLVQVGDPATAWIDGWSAHLTLLKPSTATNLLEKKELVEPFKSILERARKDLPKLNEEMREQAERLDGFLEGAGDIKNMAHAWRLNHAVASAQGLTASYEIAAEDARSTTATPPFVAAWSALEDAVAALRRSVKCADEYMAFLSQEGDEETGQVKAGRIAQLEKLIALYKDARELFKTDEKVDKRELEDKLDRLRDEMAE